jgi:CspA family cold shock protein
MQEGVIKFFNDSKGYGFIAPTNGGNDVFVHMSELVDEVSENDAVLFEVQQGKKGLNAVNVKRVK